jgi:hypothetical protein
MSGRDGLHIYTTSRADGIEESVQEASLTRPPHPHAGRGDPLTTRVERKWLETDWKAVWANLWATPATRVTKESWYRVIHDITPTQERLYAIRRAPDNACRTCMKKDTLQHRLTVCGDGRHQWEWTRRRLALMLRTDPRWVVEEWLHRPQFKISIHYAYQRFKRKTEL